MSPASTPPSPSRYVEAICRARGWILAAWILFVGLSTSTYLSAFRIDNSVAAWFLDDDPELAVYEADHDAFGGEGWIYLWVETESLDSPLFLRELRELVEDLQVLEPVSEVISLVSLPRISFGYLPSPSWSNAFRSRLVPDEDEQHTVVAIRHRDDLRTEVPYRLQLLEKIRQRTDDADTIRDFGLVGTAVINAELNRAARRDMFVYYSLITVFVLLVGGIALGNFRDLITLGAVVVGTVLPVMGSIAALGLAFNLITIMLPTLLVTVSVSYLVHFLGEFHLQRQAETGFQGSIIAISATFRRLLRPGAWTTLTTAIGFASLLLSPVEPIRQLGGFAALGIALAWLNTITIAPALLSLLWKDHPSHGNKASPVSPTVPPSRSLSPLLVWISRPHPLLTLLLAIAFLTGVSGIARLSADTNYLAFFRSDHRVRQDYERMANLGFPSDSLTLVNDLSEFDPIANLKRHRDQLQYEKSLRSIAGVHRVESLDHLIDSALPAKWKSVSSSIERNKLFLLFLQASQHSDFTSKHGQKLRTRLMTDYLGTREILRLREEIDALDAPTGIRTPRISGTNVLWSNMDSHVVRTQLLSISLTGISVLILLPIAFRSLLLGFLGFFVSFLPVVSTLGLMAWLGLPVNIATCLLGGVVIGIAVDDTIYFLSRVRDALREGASLDAACAQAVQTTGRAMIKTTIILIGGFLTMGASDFLPSVYFGLFFGLSLFLALLADLLLLPTLLRVLAGFLPRRSE